MTNQLNTLTWDGMVEALAERCFMSGSPPHPNQIRYADGLLRVAGLTPERIEALAALEEVDGRDLHLVRDDRATRVLGIKNNPPTWGIFVSKRWYWGPTLPAARAAAKEGES